MKATKRLSHGLAATGVFSWQKRLALGSANNPSSGSAGSSPVNDVFNRTQNKYISLYDQPFVFNTSVTYTLPNLKANRGLSSCVTGPSAPDCWTSVAISGGTTATPAMTFPLTRGAYRFQVTVTESLRATSTDAVATTIANAIP
jgi:hypothetical protein